MAQQCRPILAFPVVALIDDYLNIKRTRGTEVEKRVYADMTVAGALYVLVICDDPSTQSHINQYHYMTS